VSITVYFENEAAQKRALEACRVFLGGRDWAVGDRLRLYDLSHEAFHSNKGVASFRKIYEELVRPPRAGGWGIARNAAGPLWTAEKTFEALRDDFSEFALDGPVTLLNFRESKAEAKLLPLFEKMRTLKPVSNWPTIAVSKVLHFYNAELFPVYDNEVIWKKVLKLFATEFREFCRTYSPPYDMGDTPIFYRNYMCWGNALLGSSHSHFMQSFCEWLNEQPGAELNRRAFDPSRIYGTAFEYTIIGAYADVSGGQQSLPKTAEHCGAGSAA
jgi:hypothetical protein